MNYIFQDLHLFRIHETEQNTHIHSLIHQDLLMKPYDQHDNFTQRSRYNLISEFQEFQFIFFHINFRLNITLQKDKQQNSLQLSFNSTSDMNDDKI